MVHQIILAKVKGDDVEQVAEKLMIETRIRLLKVPEVLNLACGKKIDAQKNPHDFFIALEFENMNKLRVAYQNPIFDQFLRNTLEPNVVKSSTMEFEMEPAKDTKFS
jgi:hypothetical protein